MEESSVSPKLEEPPGCRCHSFFNSTKVEWGNWRWQLKHRIMSANAASGYFEIDKNKFEDVIKRYPFAISPYYASLMKWPYESDPLFNMAFPKPDELIEHKNLCNDPLAEEKYMPIPGLVHKYSDRALLLVSTSCAMYCRYCTRKRLAGHKENFIDKANLDLAIDYFKNHPEIQDVILSGGDPLMMSDVKLEYIIKRLREVKSIEIIRIGTKTPVVLPMRITKELVDMLSKYHPIYINVHFNHPNEITNESRFACKLMADAGIVLGNQSVLLKNINDDPETLMNLYRKLLSMRVRPYYLYQCDLVQGINHFRTEIQDGLSIINSLRENLDGLAVPTFIIDTAIGKVPVLPNYLANDQNGSMISFKNQSILL